MIITKKEAPSSTAIESGAVTKIVQDDLITITREEHQLYVANSIKLDMIAGAIANLRYDSERLDMIRIILDIPKEEATV